MYPTGRENRLFERGGRNYNNPSISQFEPSYTPVFSQQNHAIYSPMGQPGIAVQSASGFTACEMNMPADSHLQQLPSDNPQYNYRPQDQQCPNDECQPKVVVIKEPLVYFGNSFVTTIGTSLGYQMQLSNPPSQIGISNMRFGNAPVFVQPHHLTGRSGTPIQSAIGSTANEMNWAANGQLVPLEYNQYINPIKYDSNQHFEARTQSFNWPATTTPDPFKVADSGLFYLGGDSCCCFNSRGVLERKEMYDQFIEHKGYHLDCYRKSIRKFPGKSHLSSPEDVFIDNFASLSLEGSGSESLPNNINPDICGVCNTRKISVTQMNCRHIVCRQCLPKKDQRGKYRCRICRKEVVKTVAYDVSCIRV